MIIVGQLRKLVISQCLAPAAWTLLLSADTSGVWSLEPGCLVRAEVGGWSPASSPAAAYDEYFESVAWAAPHHALLSSHCQYEIKKFKKL